jgi:hypothetical protein
MSGNKEKAGQKPRVYSAESEVSLALPVGTISSSVKRVLHLSSTFGNVLYSIRSDDSRWNSNGPC